MERWRYARRVAKKRTDAVSVLGLDLFVPDTVLDPVAFKTGPCLARAVRAYAQEGSTVLDVGTGSGVVALYAASLGARAFATDLNPAAVRATRVNAMLNGLEVDVREGDLFAPFEGQRFDVVTFNPPFFQGAPDGHPLDLALKDRPGLPTLRRFAEALPRMLAPDGIAFVVGSTLGATDAMRACYDGFDVTLARTEERWSERLLVDALRVRS